MDFLVPKLSATMESATVRKWLKKPGERVKMGEALVEIETDKATIEVEAPADATVNTILAPEGAQLPIGGVLATLDAAGGAPTSPTSVPKAVALAPAASGPRLVAPAPQPVASPPRAASLPPRVFASPLARRLAAEHGLDLAALAGTGPHRRIRKRDVLAAASNQGRAPSSNSAARQCDDRRKRHRRSDFADAPARGGDGIGQPAHHPRLHARPLGQVDGPA